MSEDPDAAPPSREGQTRRREPAVPASHEALTDAFRALDDLLDHAHPASASRKAGSDALWLLRRHCAAVAAPPSEPTLADEIDAWLFGQRDREAHVLLEEAAAALRVASRSDEALRAAYHRVFPDYRWSSPEESAHLLAVEVSALRAASAEPSGEPVPDSEAVWDFVDDGSLLIYTDDGDGITMQMSDEVHARIEDAVRVARRAAAPVSEPQPPYGEWLRRERVAAGVSLRDLADASRMNAVRLGEIERGVREPNATDRVAIGLGLRHCTRTVKSPEPVSEPQRDEDVCPNPFCPNCGDTKVQCQYCNRIYDLEDGQ